MGLLDFSGFVGDDTTRDEFGVTQADRRQPLFTGLLKAGMLGMAAGENITPGQRAQLMGQIGGAIGDIPKGVQDVEAAGAQMQLRRQQFATNKQKLDQQRELQAYAQTPEFAEMLKGLPSHIQFGLNAAIKAGDVDAFQRLMSSYQTAQTAQAETLRKEKRDDAKADADAKKAENKGMFGGTPEGRMRDIALNARTIPGWLDDPKNAAAYAQAHAYLSQERRVTVGSATWMEPRLADLDDYPAPKGAPAAGSPAATQPKIEFPKPGEPPVVNPATGTQTWTEGDRSYVAHADDRVDVYDSSGKKISTELPKEIPPAEQAKLIEATSLRAGINDAAQKFLARWKAASPLDRAAALVNKSHPLNTAWVNTMLQAKGPALYELGVLNEGDLPQLQKALADPNTPMSAIFSKTEDVEAQVADMLGVMDARRKAKENAYQEQRRRRPKSGKRKVSRFNPQTGKIEEVEVD